MAVRATGGAGTVSDEERWEQALSIARGLPSTAALDRQRRNRRTFWIWLCVLLVGSLLAGALVGLLVPEGPGSDPGPDGRVFPLWLRVGALVVGLALEVTGLVLLVRAGQWGARWRSPASVLTRAQRRHLLRQVRGRDAVEAAHLPVAVDLAQRFVLMDRLVLAFSGVVLIQISSLGGQPLPLLALLVVSATVLVLAAVLVMVDRSRAQRFLDQHETSDR